jgi:hypothetical protein
MIYNSRPLPEPASHSHSIDPADRSKPVLLTRTGPFQPRPTVVGSVAHQGFRGRADER